MDHSFRHVLSLIAWRKPIAPASEHARWCEPMECSLPTQGLLPDIGRFTSLSLLLANIVTSWRSDTRKASSRLLNLRVSRNHRVRCTRVLGICLVAAEPHSSYDQSMWSWGRSGLHLGTYWISSQPHLSSISPCTSDVQFFCDECDENDDGSRPNSTERSCPSTERNCTRGIDSRHPLRLESHYCRKKRSIMKMKRCVTRPVETVCVRGYPRPVF